MNNVIYVYKMNVIVINIYHVQNVNKKYVILVMINYKNIKDVLIVNNMANILKKKKQL